VAEVENRNGRRQVTVAAGNAVCSKSSVMAGMGGGAKRWQQNAVAERKRTKSAETAARAGNAAAGRQNAGGEQVRENPAGGREKPGAAGRHNPGKNGRQNENGRNGTAETAGGRQKSRNGRQAVQGRKPQNARQAVAQAGNGRRQDMVSRTKRCCPTQNGRQTHAGRQNAGRNGRYGRRQKTAAERR